MDIRGRGTQRNFVPQQQRKLGRAVGQEVTRRQSARAVARRGEGRHDAVPAAAGEEARQCGGGRGALSWRLWVDRGDEARPLAYGPQRRVVEQGLQDACT